MAGTGQDPNNPGGGNGNGNGQDPTQQPTPPVQDPGQQQPVQDPSQPAVAGDNQRPQTDWRDRRIGEQQQRLRERNARIAELEAQLAQRNGQPTPQPGQGNGTGQSSYQQPPVSQQPGEIQRQINEAAARLVSQQEFNRRCNEVAEAGRRVYNNFDQRVQRLVGLVDNNDPQQVTQYNAFLNAAMETGQATRLIYDLGGDLNEASRIMSLDPVKMAVELTKMSGRVTTTDASATPRPLVPAASLAQNNRVSIAPDDPDNSDSLSTEEWMARREEQVSSRRQRTLG